MATNEEHVFDHIENLLETESSFYSTGTSSSPSKNVQAVDWKNKMRSSPFKKNRRKEPPVHEPYEEDSPFDESLPFDESFTGLGQGHLNNPAIGREIVEQGDPINASMNLPAMKEEDDDEEGEEANHETDQFWYRNTTDNATRSPADLMNEVAEANTPVSTVLERSMERSMEIAVTDVYDELSDIVSQTTPTKSPRDDGVSETPTQDQQFVMDVLAEPVDSRVNSPAKSLIKPQSPVQSKSVQPSPFVEEFTPNCQVDEMVELDQALKSMSLANAANDEYLVDETANSPSKKDLIAIDPTPITPPPNHHDMLIDPLHDSLYDSATDDTPEGIVRIQLTNEDIYGSDFQPKSLAEHPALKHEHDFSLHRNIRVNAVADTFRDEPNNVAPDEEEAQEARVMDILITPLRNMFTPQKWKLGSPKTPATEGESPSSTTRDVEGGNRFGDAIIRSNLANRFQIALGMDEDDDEFIDWKDRYCTKRQIYLISILVVLVIAFICVVSVMVGMHKNQVTAHQGMNDFYKVTGDGGSN